MDSQIDLGRRAVDGSLLEKLSRELRRSVMLSHGGPEGAAPKITPQLVAHIQHLAKDAARDFRGTVDQARRLRRLDRSGARQEPAAAVATEQTGGAGQPEAVQPEKASKEEIPSVKGRTGRSQPHADDRAHESDQGSTQADGVPSPGLGLAWLSTLQAGGQTAAASRLAVPQARPDAALQQDGSMQNKRSGDDQRVVTRTSEKAVLTAPANPSLKSPASYLDELRQRAWLKVEHDRQGSLARLEQWKAQHAEALPGAVVEQQGVWRRGPAAGTLFVRRIGVKNASGNKATAAAATHSAGRRAVLSARSIF